MHRFDHTIRRGEISKDLKSILLWDSVFCSSPLPIFKLSLQVPWINSNNLVKMSKEMCDLGNSVLFTILTIKLVLFTILTFNQAVWNFVLKPTLRKKNAMFPLLSNSRLAGSLVLDSHVKVLMFCFAAMWFWFISFPWQHTSDDNGWYLPMDGTRGDP